MPQETFGLVIDSSGVVWRYQPTAPGGMVELCTGGSAPPVGTPELGPPVEMNQGDVLAAGWYVLVNPSPGNQADPAYLEYSDGTAQMPFDGVAYLVTIV